MQNIKFAIIIFFTSLFIGCQDDYLDTAPINKIGSGAMWTTEKLSDLGVLGVYNTLRLSTVGIDRWIFDEYAFTGQNRNMSSLNNGTITSSNVLFSDYWKQNYEGIHRANNALQNLPNVPNMSDAKKGRLMAECKFLRALFYFNLNQVFKGVPVYLEPVSLAELNKSRETEAKVYETIISDLTDCINEANLPNMYAKGNADKGRVTKAAAYALRGKAYLYMKDYPKAVADLRKVGELGPTLYTGEYKLLFKQANEQHPEMIFSVQNADLPGLGSTTQWYMGTRIGFGSNWNNYLPAPDFVESFENADGSAFSWDTYLPGYSTMTPAKRAVFFLRDGLTAAEITRFTNLGADMTKYLAVGNEARLKAAYDNRDPRLNSLVITPYSSYLGGSAALGPKTYTLRWPYRGYDDREPYDIRTDTNSLYYYLWRKWVYEGTSEIVLRNQGAIDQPLIRYADVVLMLAEALNEQSFSTEAVSLVNSIRTRAGAIALQTTDASKPTYVSGQSNLRDRIRNERRWELAVEGIDLFDEIRWGTLKDKKFYAGNGIKQIWGSIVAPYSWAGDQLYNWAIPRVERDFNPSLTQNPGWTD